MKKIILDDEEKDILEYDIYIGGKDGKLCKTCFCCGFRSFGTDIGVAFGIGVGG